MTPVGEECIARFAVDHLRLLGVDNRAGLIKFAIRAGIASAD